MAVDKTTPRGARTVSRIVDAAARLFGKEGYNGATMTSVARAAGVSKGLLHYHFRSKEALLIEAQRATFKQLHRRFEERFQSGQLGMDTALEALDSLWEVVREMRGWAPFMVETMSLKAQHGPIRRHLDDFYDETMDLLEQGIRHVFAADLEHLTVPPHRLAFIVRTVIHGLIVELGYARTTAEIERLDQTYRDLRVIFSQIAFVEQPAAALLGATIDNPREEDSP